MTPFYACVKRIASTFRDPADELTIITASKFNTFAAERSVGIEEDDGIANSPTLVKKLNVNQIIFKYIPKPHP